jgi:Carboxypeptidase regulatory-like domain
MRIVRFIPAVLLAAGVASAQQQTGSIVQGTVVKTGSGAPLSKASVELRRADAGPAPAQMLMTATDLDGVFRFADVPPGRYRVIVARSGYTTGEYGQRRPGSEGAVLALTPARNAMDLKIQLTPTGAISGRIIDHRGRPLANATVQALKIVYQGELRTLAVMKSIRTNDLGEYRLFWLSPGSYYVNVVVPGSRDYQTNGLILNANPAGPGQTSAFLTWDDPLVQPRPFDSIVADNESYVPVFFRDTPDPGKSETVEVRPEADTSGIDIRAVPVRAVRVQGNAVNAGTGQPVPAAQVGLLSTDPMQTSSYGVAADSNDGTFSFAKVVPGSYMLVARAPGGLSGYVVVDLTNRESANLTVPLQTGLSIRGRIRIEGNSPLRDLTPLGVALRMDPPVPGQTAITIQTPGGFSRSRFPAPEAVVRNAAPDGTFTLTDVSAGSYRVYVNPILLPPPAQGTVAAAIPATMENLFVKSIRLGQTEALDVRLTLTRQPDEELEIVIGTSPGGVEGRVLGAGDKPSPRSSVVLLPTSSRRFRTELERTAVADSDGHFELQRVPPGDYVMYAWDDVDAGAWRDPDFMRRVESQGTPIHVREGSVERVQLVTIAP